MLKKHYSPLVSHLPSFSCFSFCFASFVVLIFRNFELRVFCLVFGFISCSSLSLFVYFKEHVCSAYMKDQVQEAQVHDQHKTKRTGVADCSYESSS